MENLEALKSSQEQEKATIILPRFTAGQIKDLSFTAKNQRRRQKRLAADTPEANAARSALKWKSLKRFADNLEKPYRDFENADWRLRDLHTQELRTKRLYATIASQQRRKIKKIVLSQSRDGTVLDHQIEASVKSSSVKPDDILDVAAKPEDAKPEAVRCVTDQPKIIEDPTRKETLNASTQGHSIAIETTEDTGATRSKSKYIV
ncbi:hypothetical protein BGZ91_000331 [Linnemannia elongata]|nr:hypothetical protein BGZ91_000331 [Linnemannia elongata]